LELLINVYQAQTSDNKKGKIIQARTHAELSRLLLRVSKDLHPGKGLPIGNLTSQLFSNIYLNELDHFVKRQLKIKYYGRYVDDFFLVHPDRDYLKQCIWWISGFLNDRLMLMLNPKKIYLQHFSKGVKFCGVIVKPHITYVDNRLVQRFRKVLASGIDPGEEESNFKSYQSSITSYLGMLEHHNSYNLTRKMGFNFQLQSIAPKLVCIGENRDMSGNNLSTKKEVKKSPSIFLGRGWGG